jgi:hypothetical protein
MKMTGLWEKITALDAYWTLYICCSSCMIFRQSSNTGSTWRKPLPGPEENDLQVFTDKDICKSKILDMECFENIKKDMLKNGYRVMCVGMTDRHCPCCHKTEGRRKGWGG